MYIVNLGKRLQHFQKRPKEVKKEMNGIFKCSIKTETARKGGESDYKQR